jgi:hypothetical protein
MELTMPSLPRVSLITLLLAGTATIALAVTAHADEAIVVVQLNEYVGPGAYFQLYLVDPEGRFDRTLWVSGDDKLWWPDSKRWYGYFSRAPEEIDAVTGASTAAGSRTVMRVEIDPALIDAGYTLRVETAVEEAENYQADAEVPLTRANERAKTPGTGYVRYIRYRL